MSNRIFALVLLSMLALVQTPAQVQFEHSNYKSAAGKARRMHKSIFVYFYTDWCAPCKQIPKIVFTDFRIRAVIDSQYVSLKLNAEKGEGITLAKRFGVVSFPTFLYTEADGHEIGRIIGTRTNDDYQVIGGCDQGSVGHFHKLLFPEYRSRRLQRFRRITSG